MPTCRKRIWLGLRERCATLRAIAFAASPTDHAEKPEETAKKPEEIVRNLMLMPAFAGFLLTASGAHAQSFTPDVADRAAALKEGSVSWYSSTPFPLVQQLADRFTQDTGVKVTLLRSGGEAVLRRFLQEYQAGQGGADVITVSDAGAATGLAKRGVFVAFRPAGF